MIAQRDAIHTISIAGCVSGCEIPQLIPVCAAMKLSIAGSEIAKGVQRGVLSVTLDSLDSTIHISIWTGVR